MDKMLNRLYLCTSCGKIILVNIFQADNFARLEDATIRIKKYTNGDPIIASKTDNSGNTYASYEIRDKIIFILGDSLIPERFEANGEEVLKIVALRYTSQRGINIFRFE